MPHSIERLITARHHDPFTVLGLHRNQDAWLLRVFRPAAASVSLLLGGGAGRDDPDRPTRHL